MFESSNLRAGTNLGDGMNEFLNLLNEASPGAWNQGRISALLTSSSFDFSCWKWQMVKQARKYDDALFFGVPLWLVASNRRRVETLSWAVDNRSATAIG